MKKIFYFVLLVFCFQFSAINLFAVPVHNKPVVRIQPNGDTLRLFVTGDEFYHRLHDADNYTVIQHPETGYWVYADREFVTSEKWNVVATDYVVGKVDPRATSLVPNIGIDRESFLKCQHKYDRSGVLSNPKTSGLNHGTLNNIVVFVCFADDNPITTPFSTIDMMFNDSSDNATSMYSYFKSVSYNKINILTHFYPTPQGDNVICYRDSLPRCRFMPYNRNTNPDGYREAEYETVELSLLERAVNYINDSCHVPETLDIDMDNDGNIDNICFVIKGESGDWDDMLWPHMWTMRNRGVYINGKLVDKYNFQLEGSGPHYFNSSVFSHEMFHTLGAPDLYRYNYQTYVDVAGTWDIMSANQTPPQNMGAYMKYKYGNWIDSIPTIRRSGTYTLHSVGSNNPDNCCYKVATPHPNQWYVLEYRNFNDFFDQTIPGSGLLVYRIDDRYEGSQDYDGRSSFDEVYVFRPGGTDSRTNGQPAQAYFSGSTTRTRFDCTTNPFPWLTGNIKDSSICVSNVSIPGETISFDVTIPNSPGDDTVGVRVVDDEPMVTVSHHLVTVYDPSCRPVAIYDITGRLVASSTNTTADPKFSTFTVPASGVYILHIVGLRARKIVVK